MRNVVPRPASLSTVSEPPCCLIIPKTVARPRPVPLPGSFVVKNGSKMRAKFPGAMPLPVSVTRRLTWRPGFASGSRAVSTAVKFFSPVSMTSWPPPGMASRALTTRLRSTWSSIPASARVSSARGWRLSWRRTSSPRMRCNILARWATISFRSNWRGCMTCRRLKARSWRVRLAARSAEALMPARYSRASGGRFSVVPTSSASIMIAARMLLKSCATPPASWPMASIFCDWRNCASSCRCSVMSSAVPTTRRISPAPPRTGKARSWIQRTVPSGRWMRYVSS